MIDISLFGTTRVRTDASPARGIDLSGVKPRRILQILAAELGNPVTKDVLAEGLWDGRPPASYVASVESYVCVLRRSLATLPGGSPLVTTHGAYLLDPELVRVDLVEVRSLLASLQHGSVDHLVGGAEQALDQMTGELLADEPFAAWAEEIRKRFDDLLENVVTRAAEVATTTGNHVGAIRLASAVLDRSRLSEPAARALMSAHRGIGGRAQALRVYSDLRSVMLEELGVEPSSGTRALYLAILDDAERSHLRERDRLEMGTLVRLLRQALESGARPDPATRTWLAEVGRTVAQYSV
jgi:DNA-binding SARP family transcriptional activator